MIKRSTWSFMRALLCIPVILLSFIRSTHADSLSQILQFQQRALSEAVQRAQPAKQLGSSQFLHALSNELSAAGALPQPPSGTVTLVQQDPRYVENAKLLFGLQLTPDGLAPVTQTSDRVWGGLSTTGYNSVVALIIQKTDTEGVGVCTGVALSSNIILTAGHCVCATVTDVYEGSSIFAPTYTHKLAVHPTIAPEMRTCSAPRTQPADIGLVQIEDEFKSVTPVTLASSGTINNLSAIRAVGFGVSETGQMGQKKYVDVPVASRACNQVLQLENGKLVRDQDFYGCSTNFELVAGQSHLNRDTCHGDSGGPVFGYVAKGGGKFDEYLVGITSRGIANAGSTTDCGQGGIYTRVDGPIAVFLLAQHVSFSAQQ